MSILCKIFGHKLVLVSYNLLEPNVCKRCHYREVLTINSHLSPMPKCKPPRENLTNGDIKFIKQLRKNHERK